MSNAPRIVQDQPLGSHPTAAFYTSTMPEQPQNPKSFKTEPVVLHLPSSNDESNDISALVSSFSAAHQSSAYSARPSNIRRPSFVADHTQAMNTTSTRSKLASRPALNHNQTSPTLDHDYDMSKHNSHPLRHHVNPHESVYNEMTMDQAKTETAVAVPIPIHGPTGSFRRSHEKKPSIVDISRPPRSRQTPTSDDRSDSPSPPRHQNTCSPEARGRSETTSRERTGSSSRVRKPAQRLLKLLSSSKDNTKPHKSQSTSQLPTKSYTFPNRPQAIPHHQSDSKLAKTNRKISLPLSNTSRGSYDRDERRFYEPSTIEEERSDVVSPKTVSSQSNVCSKSETESNSYYEHDSNVDASSGAFLPRSLDHPSTHFPGGKNQTVGHVKPTNEDVSPNLISTASPGLKKPSFPESIIHGQSILALSDSEDNDDNESIQSEPERKISFSQEVNENSAFDSQLDSNYWTGKRKSMRQRPSLARGSKTMNDVHKVPEVPSPAEVSPDPGLVSDSRSSPSPPIVSPDEKGLAPWIMSPTTMSAYTPSVYEKPLEQGPRENIEPLVVAEISQETLPEPNHDSQLSITLTSPTTKSRRVMSVTLEEAELLATMRRRRELVQHRLMGVADDLAINPSQAFAQLQDVPESPTTTIDDDQQSNGDESDYRASGLKRPSFSSNVRSSLSGQARPPSASDTINQVWADVQAWRKAHNALKALEHSSGSRDPIRKPGATMRSRGRKPPALKQTVSCDSTIPLSAVPGTTDHAAVYLNAGWMHGPRSVSIWSQTGDDAQTRQNMEIRQKEDVTRDIMAAWNDLGGWRRSGTAAV